jgi:hypothetical protein
MRDSSHYQDKHGSGFFKLHPIGIGMRRSHDTEEVGPLGSVFVIRWRIPRRLASATGSEVGRKESAVIERWGANRSQIGHNRWPGFPG